MNGTGGGRRLVVNADDLGLSSGVNRGIFEAHDRGIVTSASLLVRGEAAEAAAVAARRFPKLGLGLHVDVGEWGFDGGEWIPRYTVVDPTDPDGVAAEMQRQLDMFHELVGRDPTHLDSHQHVHRREPMRSALLRCGRRLERPVRHETPGLRYCGDFHGQTRHGEPRREDVSVPSLLRLLRSLPPGTTELACHPGYASELPRTTYRGEREVEVRSLCDPRVRATLHQLDITLCSFLAVAPDRRADAAAEP